MSLPRDRSRSAPLRTWVRSSWRSCGATARRGRDERTQYDELSELAVMSALGKWLRRWQPIAIHGAMLAGARPEAVAGALGNSLQVAYERWYGWAVRQRDFITSGSQGITAEEFDTVARRFAALGIRGNDFDGEGSDLPNGR